MRRFVGPAVAGRGHRPRASDDGEGARRAQPGHDPVGPGETTHVDSVAVVVEPVEPKRRTRTTLIIVGIGVVVAASLVAFGFAQSDDDSPPGSTVPPTIGAIQAPAEVSATSTTLSAVAVPGSSPDTVDVPVFPSDTADVALPPITAGTLVP